MDTVDELQNKVNGCDSENSQEVNVSPFGRYKSNTESMPTLFHSTLYLCIMSILLHNMFALISYATCEWPEMYSFQYSSVLFYFSLSC